MAFAEAYLARFCLLEQYLPDGEENPFAKKMLQHFNNLQTSLKNVANYPALEDQVKRFSKAGFASVQARSLWDVFKDPLLVSYEERIALDQVEPFDEWEELVLFASHYFLLVAKQQSDNKVTQPSSTGCIKPLPLATSGSEWSAIPSILTTTPPGKKFGMILSEGSHDSDIYHVGGFGPQSRTAMTNSYRVQQTKDPEPVKVSDRWFSSLPLDYELRMCSTSTPLGFLERDWLLTGGRKSPLEPLKDCWLLRKNRWQRVDDLPLPLYRHCSTSINVGLEPINAVLLHGGKTSNNVVSDQWLLWQELAGWETVTANIHLTPVFGAAMIPCGSSRGFLLGGMSSDGMIRESVYFWNVKYSKDNGWHVHLTECVISTERSDPLALKYLSRFGATIERTTNGFLVVGGVANEIIPSRYDVIEISLKHDVSTPSPLVLSLKPLIASLPSPRPLLVGHSSLSFAEQLIIIGGGAVCFSFGTHWNTAPITFSTRVSSTEYHWIERIVFLSSSDGREIQNKQPNHLNLEANSEANTIVRKEIAEGR